MIVLIIDRTLIFAIPKVGREEKAEIGLVGE